MDGLLSMFEEQFKKGEPYRDAFRGLLRGDTSGWNKLNAPSLADPQEAVDIATGFAGTIKPVQRKVFEEAFNLAQQRAALPVSEGGLGLPATNTAMDRAKAMGFDTSTTKYHGTNADINAFDYSKTGKGQDQWGSGFYFTDRPSTANAYVNPLNVAEGGNVYPVYTKIENPLKYDPTSIALQKDISQSPLTKKEIKDLITKSPNLDDALWNWGDWASEGKNKVINDAVNAYYNPKSFSLQTLNSINNDFYSGIPKAFNENAKKAMGKDALKVGFESGETFDVMWNPSNIRSVNAAFDPFRRNEPDILAGVAAAPAGLLAIDEEKPKKKRSNK
jgi:hypothetical protein